MRHVDTSVKPFHSAMSGAPVLNGVAGSWAALIDALLRTGFDPKAATSLVVAGGVATLSFSGSHSAEIDSVVLVEGVTGALTDLNGEQKVTALGADQVKFATAAADGTAAGTITFKMAPAGWLRPFSKTNVAVYQSADAMSTKQFVRFDDTTTTWCRLRGYETMTDVDTGAGLFPLDGQINGGGYMNKSSGANTNAVKWRIFADQRGMIINIVGGSATTAAAEAGRTIYIGDYEAFRPGGDPYAFGIGCGTAGGAAEANGTCDQSGGVYQYMPRSFHGLGSSVGHLSLPETGTVVTSGTDLFFGKFPSKIDGGLRLSRRFIADGVNSEPRSTIPGLYTIPQSEAGLSIAPLSIQPGTGVLAGRKLMAVGCGAGNSSYPATTLGISMVDITGPWKR